MMRILRHTFPAATTLGTWFLNDGRPFCFTLEDEVRPAGIKVPGATAIPAGVYPVELTKSPRFKRELPLFLDVPNFVGVRAHRGINVEHTEGCVLVGFKMSVDPPTLDDAQEAEVALVELFRGFPGMRTLVEIVEVRR